MSPGLFAVSDLHVGHADNRPLVERIHPEDDGDWLIVAGDVAELAADIERVLARLRERFAKVIWVPGNHDLWTMPADPLQDRGDRRYRRLVETCRSIGVVTPEDPYPVWEEETGPLTIAPLFLLYDYSFHAPELTNEQALAASARAGIVFNDEFLLHPDPYPSRVAWCAARLAETEPRLAAIPADHRTILVSHWPLHRQNLKPLRHPEIGLWSGTTRTQDWHVRFRAHTVVYGHLHIPITSWIDGVRFEEVSIGYPRERNLRLRMRGDAPLVRIVPPPATTASVR